MMMQNFYKTLSLQKKFSLAFGNEGSGLGEEMGREKKGCSFYIATQDEIRHNKYDLKVIKYVEDKIERKEIDVKVALQRIDELEERLKCIDKQFKDCAWRLRELTKE